MLQTKPETSSNISPTSSELLTVKQFSAKHRAWTEAALRNLIHKSERRHSSIGIVPGNGLAEVRAVVRVGRKVLLDEGPFFAWVRAKAEEARK